MSDNHHKYTHAFLCIQNIGSETLRALSNHFGSIEKAWLAPSGDIEALPNMRANKKDAIISGRKMVDPEKEWEKLLASDIQLLTLDDPEFPTLLREIPDAPYTLYTTGSFDWTKMIPMIAIVGSRKFTAYGEQVAIKIATGLTRAGLLVVSGLAYGIDSVAHEATLAADGETIAVLGSGIKSISPATHVPLARKIMEHGAVISEYQPAMNGDTWTFPARNRIIAGMTLGTVVIEAAEGSGSLITAQCALEYNREVFAIPGSVFSPYSIGTNNLIKRGAKVVTGVQDILEELRIENIFSATDPQRSHANTLGLSPEEHIVLSSLSHEPLHVDKIIKTTKLSSAETSSLLSLLEIKGLAKNVGGMHYVKGQ